MVGSAGAAAEEAWLTGWRRLLADRMWAARPRGFGAIVLVGPPTKGKWGGAEGAFAVGKDWVAALFVSADAPAAAGATAAVEAADAPLSLADDAGSGATGVVAAGLLHDVRRRVVWTFSWPPQPGPFVRSPYTPWRRSSFPGPLGKLAAASEVVVVVAAGTAHPPLRPSLRAP